MQNRTAINEIINAKDIYKKTPVSDKKLKTFTPRIILQKKWKKTQCNNCFCKGKWTK